MERERERGAARERVPFPKSNSNSNSYPNSNPESSQHKISTVFVRNLPPTLDLLGLRGIFSRFGRVEEVSIPAKQKGSSRFGFVKFENHGVASRSIRVGNNRLVRGSKIVVCFARRELFRFRQAFPSRYRQHQRSASPRPDFNPKRAVDADLLVSLEQILVVEVEKMGQLRKALEAILESFEGLVDSKSVRTIVGVLSEVAENLKEAYPNFSPSPLKPIPIPENPPLFSSVGLSGKKEGGIGSCFDDVEVVEDSISNSKPGSEDIEDGEIPAKELEVDVGGSKSVEAMVLEVDKSIPDPDLDPDFAPDQPCFSFNSKSKRRRKKSIKPHARKRFGKSRRRQPNLYPKSGEKRKLSCQGSHPYQGDGKKLKRSIDPNQQGQGEADPAIEASNNSPFVNADGGVVGVTPDSSLDDEDVEDSSDEGDEENSEESSDTELAHLIPNEDGAISEESSEEEARRIVDFGSLLGVKPVGNKEGVVKRVRRAVKRFNDYVMEDSSEDESPDSQEF